MVQPHLDEKANPVPAVNPNENCLIGKHFAELNILREKLAVLVGIRKMLMANNQEKKLTTFAENVIDLFVKIVFGNTIPRTN